MRTLITLTLFCTLVLPALTMAGNISATSKYAWSETSGWSNLAPSGGVTVCDDHLEGFAWGENIGWIRLGSHSGCGYFTYANSGNSDYGVNLTGSALSGYGWSETAGWVNFNPAGGGVTINPVTRLFGGYAWSENLGWLNFNGIAVNADAYGVLLTPNPQVNSILIDPDDAQKLRATVEGSGIRLSSDKGATWTTATTQPGDWRMKASVIKPGTPATMYSASHGNGVFTSIDGGVTWASCTNSGLNPSVYSLVIDSSGTIHAGTKGGVFSSADCTSWSPKNGTLPNSGGVFSQIVLAITPTALYAGISGSGIYKTADSGATWTAATSQPGNNAIRALVAKNANLYAATYGGGVYKSGNSGVDWNVPCGSQPANKILVSLVIDGNGTLYAGSEAGVFVSADGCGSWTVMNNGLP
jgi:hypothetical protein